MELQSIALPTELPSQILREQDLNLRPSGYEPDELPTAPPRDNVKEDKGFEPLHAFTRLTVFKTVPFSRTWVILQDITYGPCRTRTYDRTVMSRLL